MGEYLTGPNDGRPLKTQDWMLEEGFTLITRCKALEMECAQLKADLLVAVDAALVNR